MTKIPLKKSKTVVRSLLGTGLRETPLDERDYQLGAVYGLIDIKKVPMGNFNLPRVKIKNQGSKDFCGTYMATSASEAQEEIELGPDWQFSQVKKMQGEYESWGTDLRTAMLSLVKIGSIPKEVEDEFLKRQGYLAEDRDFLANWNNWPESFNKIAEKHKKRTLFEVKGPYDAFDNVRAALWQHRNDRCKVAMGVMWRYNWNNAPGGIIPLEAEGPGEGHAILGVDQVYKNGELYIVIPNSWGEEVGDKGVFYANREVFNAHFANFKFFMVKDLPKEVAKYLIQNNLSIKSAWWVKIVVFFRDLFTRYQPK